VLLERDATLGPIEPADAAAAVKEGIGSSEIPVPPTASRLPFPQRRSLRMPSRRRA